ncbi:MAG: hypothetical protein JO116_02895 [Planctomycetaceae bacterium]|nr:hypothetical protein [Planctomycetaceae bacterium]
MPDSIPSRPRRVFRTALLLRGRRLALLADQAAAPLPESRDVSLIPARGRGSAQVLPLGLPCFLDPTDRGAISWEAGSLDLGPAEEGRRCWLPLLVSWDPIRGRMQVRWRVLTISEGSKACPPRPPSRPGSPGDATRRWSSTGASAGPPPVPSSSTRPAPGS